MLYSRLTASQKRRAFRAALNSGRLQRMPGAFSPLVAMAIARRGFEGVYISGGALAADLGLPDIGLTTLSEVAARSAATARMVDLPTLVDADTGFGEPLNAARTVQVMEEAGVSGCHFEDQENPKRCGHLDGTTLVPVPTAVRRIAAAVAARRDPDFIIGARTDAKAHGGIKAVVERAKAYADAGADLLFPEALADAEEFEAVRAAVDIPILANMTEFGKSTLLTVDQLRDLGVNVVIYPVTMLRVAMGAITRALESIDETGTQADLVDDMQHRHRLYELLGYSDYTTFDTDVFDTGGRQ
ncbi:methylisocitrate lyase [Stackebrandtia endophytica]|uniref:Methylisocitrate lyase n=1 Tax=Stackebrandtia endophytica TaxID=1496996 RepID=A0A543B3V9_9ACTN|nr:methylisocitrate lyase [Stackebrandtia endophytica]TQL79450.1 methylisocitrate lyase [Stackebrandtia endophytica]